MTENQRDLLMTTEEVASRLRVNPCTIRRWRRSPASRARSTRRGSDGHTRLPITAKAPSACSTPGVKRTHGFVGCRRLRTRAWIRGRR